MTSLISSVGVTSVMLLFGLAGLTAQDLVTLDEIVAKINSETITLSDLQNESRLLRVSLRERIRDPQELEARYQEQRKGLLKNMIQSKMTLQKAEELGIMDNIDVEVSARLEVMRKKAGIPDMEVFDHVLKQQGSSLREYRSVVRREMAVEILMEQFVYAKITLLTPEIEAYYQQNIDRFSELAEVELAEILFLTEGKDKDLVRTKMEEVLAQLGAGVPFEDLAKQFSEGPTAPRGGGIGTFKEGSMTEAIQQVAFSLEEGKTSGVVQTDYGMQILKVIRKTPAREKPLEKVRAEIQRELYAKKAEPEVQEFMEDLRQQTYIYIASEYREKFDLEGL